MKSNVMEGLKVNQQEIIKREIGLNASIKRIDNIECSGNISTNVIVNERDKKCVLIILIYDKVEQRYLDHYSIVLNRKI